MFGSNFFNSDPFFGMMFEHPQHPAFGYPQRSFFGAPSQHYSRSQPRYYNNVQSDDEEDDVVYYRPSNVRSRPAVKKHRSPAQLKNNHQTLQRQKQQQELLKKQNEAALVIQKAFRNYMAVKKSEAVRVISEAFLRYRAKQLVHESIIAPLKSLSQLESSMSDLQEMYLNRRRVFEKPIKFETDTDRLKHVQNRDLLEYENSLMKLTLKIDAIQSGGCEYLRNARKALVRKIQDLLDDIDAFKNDQIARRHQELAEAANDSDICLEEDSSSSSYYSDDE